MAKITINFHLGLLLLCFQRVCLALPKTNTTDQASLLALRARITEEPHQILAKNWSVGSPVCEWIGITCGSRHHRVTVLNVSHMSLTGTIPPQLGNLSFLISLDVSANNFHGELPREFARFRRLKALNLGFNNLTGEFPPWIGSLYELEHLSLRNNSFTGLIPPSISNLSKLATLHLLYNSLQGNIPAEIFNLSSLEMFALDGNSLYGSLPDNICQHLPRLNWLSLSSNELTGQIPSSLGQCLQLQALFLVFNKFTGVIPTEIGNLRELRILSLAVNMLEGTIPKTIANLTMLEEVDFGDMNLTGEIPKEIGNLTMLTLLYFGFTNITGEIPREIGNLYNIREIDFGYDKLTGLVPTEMFNLSTVRRIEISRNQLSGNLPSTIGHGLGNIERLYLYGNNFGGVIPDTISNCSKLYIIELSENNFTGSIPTSLGNLRLLQILYLGTNNLMSDSSSSQLSFIESLTNCKDLMSLGVSDNPLNGFLPDAIGNLSTSLEDLFLDACKVRGTIPNGIGNLSSLVTLSLSGNQLTGALPTTFKDLQKIQAIDLSGNKISISLQHFCDSQNLWSLNLRENHILDLGIIPECLGNITSLRNLYLDSTGLRSNLPETLWKMKDLLVLSLSYNLLSGPVPPEINVLNAATIIDLSENHFSGNIPSTIGDMVNLKGLFLRNNRLQGSIPDSFGKMLSLERLVLSHNFLSGSIPMSLETLQYLTDFNVSFNNLSGEIPSGGPFTNFTAESFIFNEALCGAQRFRVPPCQRVSAHTLRKEKLLPIVFVLLGVIVIVGAMSFGFVYLRCKRTGNPSNVQGAPLLIQPERISYYKLLQATEGFNQSNLLGTGSFGSVYKGTLDDGRVVAIKVFNLLLEGSFKSFAVECEVLCKLRHRNLTKVISSCSTPDFKALVLEYMPNGSLEKWLYSHNYFLNSIQRLDILIDVAYALQYLHSENSTPVVHCDLKPSNVLLDQAMVAHVSDFGIAKLLGHEDSISYTKTLATLGYLAPEYGLEGLVSKKCDVYSFGIMMMEVFTRMSPNSEMFGENLNLKSWVKDSMPDGLARIIDANLLGAAEEYSPEILACISSIMEVALNCTKESPRERRNIQDVLAALNKIKLQLLPYKDVLEGLKEMV